MCAVLATASELPSLRCCPTGHSVRHAYRQSQASAPTPAAHGPARCLRTPSRFASHHPHHPIGAGRTRLLQGARTLPDRSIRRSVDAQPPGCRERNADPGEWKRPDPGRRRESRAFRRDRRLPGMAGLTLSGFESPGCARGHPDGIERAGQVPGRAGKPGLRLRGAGRGEALAGRRRARLDALGHNQQDPTSPLRGAGRIQVGDYRARRPRLPSTSAGNEPPCRRPRWEAGSPSLWVALWQR
jgi:hypothetical protein